MVSLVVSIFRPASEPTVLTAATAAFGARVRPVHVTVTAPAARVAVDPRAMVMASAA